MKRLSILLLFIITTSSFSQSKNLKDLALDLDLQNQDTTKVNTSLKIVKLLYNSKDYTTALKFANESEKLCRSLNYLQGSAKIKHLKGLIYLAKKDFNKALTELKASKLIFVNLKDTFNVAKINSDLALLEIEYGDKDLGMKYALYAITELENGPYINELINTYTKLIASYKSVGFNNKAIVFGLKKLGVLNSQKNSDQLTLIKTHKELALLYLNEGNFDKAIYYLNTALNYDDSNKILQSDLFPILGLAHMKKGAYNTATNYLKKGLAINRNENNIKGIITSLSYLADINLKFSHYKSAESQLVEVSKLAKQIHDSSALLNNYERFIILDSLKGDFKRAFKHQSAHFNLLTSLTKDTNTALKSEPILNTATSENLIISKINRDATVVSKNKFDRFMKRLYLLLLGFSILTICLAITYFNRNKGLKYTRDLELKNKNMELQKEAILEENKHFEDINNTKDKLFSIVSHDLKDSLTSTKGIIDLLKEGSVTKDEFDSLLPELSETANNASLLLFNLLNWSKSQMKSLESKPITFDIEEVFKEKIKLVEQKLIAKNIMLINNSSSGLVYADRSMIEIVIQNIITNAIKFSSSSDKITITNTTANDRLTISISDTGVGISEENIPKLFGEDKSFSTIGTHNEKGTGLGLSICKDLIALNHGRIWVESTLQVGSTFYIELPVFDETKSSPSENRVKANLL